MPEICPLCDDTGLCVVERADGSRFARTCECRVARRAVRLVEQARIPRRYAHCTLESYDTQFPSADRSLKAALVQARSFVKAYPLETDGKGLMLIGGVGIGKTHLAVGILQALISERGARGLFYDYRDLLKEIQNSYGRNDVSEREILAPVFEAEVLVLDELGAAKPTDWVWDTVQHILNTRYNDRRTTIITTNYPNEKELPAAQWAHLPRAEREAKEAMQGKTLGDRITDRMLSRLQEMCVIVDMNGVDFRTIKRATFA